MVFWLQAVLAWIVSLPLLAVMRSQVRSSGPTTVQWASGAVPARHLREKPAYRDFVARTSAFLPLPPRRDR